MTSSPMIARVPEGSPFEQTLNVLVLGESGVGKTCLVTQYMSPGAFTLERPLAFCKVPVDISSMLVKPDDKIYRLNITATAGDGAFGGMTEVYLRGAMGIVLVYDVSDLSSFESLRHWVEEIREYATDQVPLILVGNKVDDSTPFPREVSKEGGQAYARELGAQHFESSAMTGNGVVPALDHLVRNMLKTVLGNPAFDEARKHTATFRALGTPGDDDDGEDDYDDEDQSKDDSDTEGDEEANLTPDEGAGAAVDPAPITKPLAATVDGLPEESGKTLSPHPSVMGLAVSQPGQEQVVSHA